MKTDLEREGRFDHERRRLVGGPRFEKMRVATLNSPISVGHTISLVKVELMWIQDHGSPSKSSRRLSTNTLNITYKTKVAQSKIITHISFLE